MQTTIFDVLYPTFKITKPIRLIEFFGGYGSQALALKYLGVEFEHWKLCEWAIKSIQAYKDIHMPDDNEDYSMLNNLSYEKLVDILYNYGISQNYNEPMKLEQIKRLGEKQVRKIFNNIVATHNLVNIQKVKGYSLEIEDTDKYCYIMTYSFPCQDLSLAGKGKGMSDTSTRSGMLWEVERILTECKELGSMPQVLLMENVPQVHSIDNMPDFHKWQVRLEELGYHSYWQDLIATDYGIPQTRNRCFMVSILGNYSYTFPKPIPLKLKLKDMLEDNVDEKYYLSDKMIEFFTKNEEQQKDSGNGFRFNVSDGNVIAKTITTRAGSRMDDNFIGNKVLKETLETKDKIQTLTTNGGNDRGVVVTENYVQWKQKGLLDIDCRAYFEDKVAPTTTTTPKSKILQNNLRIRKLTPRETGRLMGVKDEDITKMLKNQSDSSAFHCFGDSIVVNVLMALFKELL